MTALYTAPEAAAILGISVNAIDTLVRRLKLTPTDGKSISSWRFSQESIDKRIATRDQAHTNRHAWNGGRQLRKGAAA